MQDINELLDSIFGDVNHETKNFFVFIPDYIGLALFKQQYYQLYYKIIEIFGICSLVIHQGAKSEAAFGSLFNLKFVHQSSDRLWYTMLNKDKSLKYRVGIFCFDQSEIEECLIKNFKHDISLNEIRCGGFCVYKILENQDESLTVVSSSQLKHYRKKGGVVND